MKKGWRFLGGITVFLCALLIAVPLYMLFTGSFMSKQELLDSLGPAFGLSDGKSVWHLLPYYPTLQPYVELLLDTPEFFVMFWNSSRQVFCILLGLLLVAVPAAWALGRLDFRGRRVLYWLYIVLMILPFQVTMVSNYLVLDRLRLMDTHWAVILPAVFSTFPVFVMTKFFSSIPRSMIEAAQLDGAGSFRTFLYVGMPLGQAGIVSAAVLVFLEFWNAIEQPMIFLSDKSKYPLSLYLPQVTQQNIGMVFVCSLFALMPSLLLFLYGQNYLESGIQASGIKG